MHRVLIIEDEVTLRKSMAKGLQKLDGVEVVEAGTVDEALRIIDGGPVPALILSDIDMPDRSGIELLGELGTRNLRLPVVFISAYLKAYRAQIPRHAAVEVYEKPVSLEELRRIVTEKTGLVEPAEESTPFSVVDFLQLACMGRHSVLIEVIAPGKPHARIQIVNGQVWSAEDPQGKGFDAFRRLAFGTPQGVVSCHTLKEAEGGRELDGNWEEMLMEAARITDEEGAGVAGEEEAELPDIFEAEPLEEGDGFDELFDDAVNALLAKDYAKAYADFTRALELRPGEKKAEANLARLRDMGHGTPTEA
jgi:CheY-like chemotaxis protein